MCWSLASSRVEANRLKYRMLIEFTGCTGSGKTTLSEIVIKKLSEMGVKTVVVHPRAFYVFGIKLKNETVQNMIRDLKAFPFVVLAMKRYSEFLLFAIRVLKRDADSFLTGLNLFRSVIRKIGTYELLRRRCVNNEVVIFDESTVHTAHNLFIHLISSYSDQDIIEFTQRVPLPDIVVCVKAPHAVLLERAFNREDPPRRQLSRHQLQTYVSRANALFERLADAQRIRGRLMTVNYFNNSVELAETLGSQIVDHIMKVRKI